MPYTSPHAGNVARLMLASGEAQARAAEQSGAAWAGGIQQLGNIAANSVASLARYHEEQPFRDYQKLALDDATRTIQHKNLIDQAWNDAGGDPEKAIKLLEDGHNAHAAMAVRAEVAAQRKTTLESYAAQLTVAEKRLKVAGDLFPTPPTESELEAQPQAAVGKWALDAYRGGDNQPGDPEHPAVAAYRETYKAVLPQLHQVLGDELGAALPDPDDPNLITRARKASEWGQTAAEKIAGHRAAIASARLAIDAGKDRREQAKYYTESVGHALSVASNQQEWTGALQSARAMGAPDQVLAQFPTTWSAEAQKKATTMRLDAKEEFAIQNPGMIVPGASTEYNDWNAAYAKKHSELGRDLTEAEKGALWATVREKVRTAGEPLEPVEENGEAVYRPRSQAAGKKVGRVDTFEETTKRQAETWRSNQLGDLAKRRAKGGTQEYNPASGKYDVIPIMTTQQIADEKARIEEGYRRQLSVADKKTPAAKPSNVPDAVWQTLQGKHMEPGTYTFRTSGTWEVSDDGQVRQVKQ